MEYPSLHSYLNACFAEECIVTDEMIQRAKQAYRKLYLSQYQKRYRERYVQVSFRLTKKQYDEFANQAQDLGMKITTLIKRNALSQHHQVDTRKTQTMILDIMDTIEETQHENTTPNLQELLQQLERIYTSLT